MQQELSFEALLEKHRIAVERYINFRLINRFDADDVIGETYYAAFIGYKNLRDKSLFNVIFGFEKNMAAILYRSIPFLTYPMPNRQRITVF